MKDIMEKIEIRSKVEAVFTFKWISSLGKHEENYFCNINVWRDIDLLPKMVKEQLMNSYSGQNLIFSFSKGEIFPYSEKNIIEVDRTQFKPPRSIKMPEPRIGRFYPLGFFVGLGGVFQGNLNPTRIVGIDEKLRRVTIDTNVPIAKYDIEVAIEVQRVSKKSVDIGGECKNWFTLPLENGPGMQVRFDGIITDFELDSPESFKREDEINDDIFYKQPRITSHIDDQCHDNLLNLYDKILPKEGKILDLMSSWQSHLPSNNYYIIGLGLNKEEMKQNNTLNEYIIFDLNKEPSLPFKDEDFDMIVCDLSIEYVTKPFEVVKEIKRILKPDGIITFSFSNRYFPPKVINLWIDLHEFERMGYVLEILLREGGFKNFCTYSYRGYKRPYYDKYYTSTALSDPLYLIYAQKA